MTKTVKELCTTSKDEMGNFPKSMYELSLIFDKRINDILQAYEKDIKIYAGIIQKLGYEHKEEIAKKDKEINSFKQQIDMAHNFNQNLGSEIEEFKKQQLYKEDFYIQYYCSYHGHWDQCVVEVEEEPTEEQLSKYIVILKDSSNYDKLPSKDVK